MTEIDSINNYSTSPSNISNKLSPSPDNDLSRKLTIILAIVIPASVVLLILTGLLIWYIKFSKNKSTKDEEDDDYDDFIPFRFGLGSNNSETTVVKNNSLSAPTIDDNFMFHKKEAFYVKAKLPLIESVDFSKSKEIENLKSFGPINTKVVDNYDIRKSGVASINQEQIQPDTDKRFKMKSLKLVGNSSAISPFLNP